MKLPATFGEGPSAPPRPSSATGTGARRARAVRARAVRLARPDADPTQWGNTSTAWNSYPGPGCHGGGPSLTADPPGCRTTDSVPSRSPASSTAPTNPAVSDTTAGTSPRAPKRGPSSSSRSRPTYKPHARFIPPVNTSSIPSHVITLSVRADPVADGKGRTAWEYVLKSWAAVWRHRRAGRPDAVVRATGTTAADWWLFAARVATRKRRPWVVAPDAESAFRVLGGWGFANDGLIGWGNLTGPTDRKEGDDGYGRDAERCQLVLSDRCCVIGHTLAPGRLVWVSVSNYLACDLPEFAASVNLDYDGAADTGPAGATFQHDPAAASAVLDVYFARLMAEYLRDGGGHWRTTAAQLSHQTWRRSFYSVPVLEHDDAAVAAAEREGIYGGRAEAYYFGTVGDAPGSRAGELPGPNPVHGAMIDGPVYTLDIRSQYPAILRDRAFPIAFRRWERDATPAVLASLCRTSGVLARVRIRTGDADYPVRVGGERSGDRRDADTGRDDAGRRSERRVLFPTGEFWTWLYGPELSHALARDRVVGVGPVAVYVLARPFRDYAASLIDRRANARDANDPCREGLLKLLANSFAGKFAARPGGWRTVRGVPCADPWDEWTDLGDGSGEPVSYRAVAGVVQRYERDDGRPAGVPSVFGYLTSYGRVQLLETVRAAGPHGCLWCHTDGVTVTQEGLARIRAAGLIGDGEAGRLRETGPINRLRQWGPNHYFADGVYTLSGFAAGSWHDTRGTIYDWQRDTVSSVIAARGAASVSRRVRSSSLDTQRQPGLIGPDGWAFPPRLFGDVPELWSVADG